MAQKQVSIAGQRRTINGLSDEDPYFKGFGEVYGEDFVKVASRFLEPDSYCWDIGANIGMTALALNSLCPQGRHLALEPNREVFDLLSYNLQQNGVNNFKVIRGCAGEKDGTAKFQENSAYGHIAAEGVSVEMFGADSLLTKSGEGRVDFIKVDIEGFEHPFLSGAENVLGQYKPAVYLEFNSYCIIMHMRQSPHILAEWIMDFFPYVYRVDRDEERELVDIKPLGLHFLHDHLVFRQAIEDLVCTFYPILNK